MTIKQNPEKAEDPYQADFGPYVNDDWFRHQNAEVMDRTECLMCEGSLPWSDEFSWKYAAAGGLLEGPFCSKECHFDWLLS